MSIDSWRTEDGFFQAKRLFSDAHTRSLRGIKTPLIVISVMCSQSIFMVITHCVRLKSSLRAARALSSGASRGGWTLFALCLDFFFMLLALLTI